MAFVKQPGLSGTAAVVVVVVEVVVVVVVVVAVVVVVVVVVTAVVVVSISELLMTGGASYAGGAKKSLPTMPFTAKNVAQAATASIDATKAGLEKRFAEPVVACFVRLPFAETISSAKELTYPIYNPTPRL